MNLLFLCLSMLLACNTEADEKAQATHPTKAEIETKNFDTITKALPVSEQEIPKKEIKQADEILEKPSQSPTEIVKDEPSIIKSSEPIVIATELPKKSESAPSNKESDLVEKPTISKTEIPTTEAVFEKEVQTSTEDIEITDLDSNQEEMDDVIETVQVEEVELLPYTHEKWQKLLSNYVDQKGFVDYQGFKNDEAKLDAYLSELSNEDLSSYGAAQKKAFFINAYNAFTIKLIVENYPLKSILDLHGGKTWDRKWISLGGEEYSLNEIEHQLLIRDFSDSRVHFAINCAAKSCPPLSNKAFTSTNVESELNALTKAFLSNEAFNKISSSSAELSKLFEWYAKDFGDVKAYLSKYLGVTLDDKVKLKYKEYDWSLNGK